MPNIVLNDSVNPSVLDALIESYGESAYVTLCPDALTALQERVRNMPPKQPDIIVLAYGLQQCANPDLLYARTSVGRKLLE